jgi:thymidylate synthase (FAD)
MCEAPDEATAICELAGRLCYNSFNKRRPGGTREYFHHILASGHGSVLEHASYTFLFADVSRSLTHELVRHRHFSYSQRSQRYVDESDAPVVVPFDLRDDYTAWQNAEGMRNDPDLARPVWNDALFRFHHWAMQVEESLGTYRLLVKEMEAKLKDNPDLTDQTQLRKRIRQTSRSILPACVATQICVTGNARAWRGFLDQRATIHAEPEIRQLAGLVHEKLLAVSPELFGDYLVSGNDCLLTNYRKV